MGCISSKNGSSPSYDVSGRKSGRRSRSGRAAHLHGARPLEKIKEEPEDENDGNGYYYSGNLWVGKKGVSAQDRRAAAAAFSIRFGRLTEGEHVAAGWPGWLSAVAGEAIDGWLPLRTEKFQRLDKIGQGTYSDVYRARDLETGKMVALKRVRFDNFQPESVRFMAREIMILRRLNHPNIMKLEGIITSRLSSSIHLVFEYMEHDLAGLISSPDVRFTDSQIKCYTLQLLRGIEHCHSHGIMHRDIKTSNILVNNDGILKIADFGLANFFRPRTKQPLTSRVVTLWYRPPELLLGSTHYGEAVDLWSVGCVVAELFIGRPILKGRTEVEQLHKIFKLCGSPQDEYWKRCKLPLATMFKPQQPYESTLRQRCKELPKSAVSLIESLLSIEPHRRGTASLAIRSEYFNTKPYACEPSNLPKYPPNKEIDAKVRDDARRRKAGSLSRAQTGTRNSRRLRKTLQEPSEFFKVVPQEEVDVNVQGGGRTHIRATEYMKKIRAGSRTSFNQRLETMSQASQATQESHVSTTLSVPAHVTGSGFAWAKVQKHDAVRRMRARPSSRSHRPTLDSYQEEDTEHSAMPIPKTHMHHKQDSFDASEIYEPPELSRDYINRNRKNRINFSAPLIQPQDNFAAQIGQSREHHRSRFYQGQEAISACA